MAQKAARIGFTKLIMGIIISKKESTQNGGERMAESQNVEYKELWRDEYLKWVCGFANAQGGRIYIGRRDDGTVVGVADSKRLMEDIPNKISDTVGVMADVNLLREDGKDYIEITVRPSAYPVSYHGEYHYRSGSTKQQLRGTALTEFLMRKTGIRWEDVTVDDITVDDLDDESFKIFRREALRSKRMTSEDLAVSNAELLSKLHLIKDGKLKRSAVLLFYHDPSVIQNGSYVKIGKFDGPELLYQDPLELSLIQIADKVIDLIYLKYLKAKVSYEHDRRVETYPFARDAVREAVYNAIAHNCYMYGSPIQIRIEGEAMIISNRCILPDGWTVETLMEPHDSMPYNPDIANVFYRAGYIEHWGRGIEKICTACDELGAARPKYELLGNGLRVRFDALKSAVLDDSEASNNSDIGKDVGINVGINVGKGLEIEQRIISLLERQPTLTIAKLAEELHVTRRTIERNIRSLREKGKLIRKGARKNGIWEIVE